VIVENGNSITTQSFDVKKTHVGKDGKVVTTTKSVVFQVQQKPTAKKIPIKEKTVQVVDTRHKMQGHGMMHGYPMYPMHNEMYMQSMTMYQPQTTYNRKVNNTHT